MSDSDQRVADYLITSRGKEAVIKSKNPSVRELAERTLLESFTPCAVIINEKGAILYVHGRSGKYLEVGPGEANLNLVAMTREGLRFEVASAIKTAFAEGKEIRHERLRVKTNGDEQVINLIVRPILQNAATNRLCMVVFEDAPVGEIKRRRKKKSASTQDNGIPGVQDLEQELRTTKEHLRTVLSEKDAYSEELRSLTEEFQSSNEELQSTNEELLTSQEELQSLNEELVTVNSELEEKIIQSSREVNDMKNLLASTGIGTLYLDSNLNIRRFTPAMVEFMNLIKTDVGRPVSHIVSRTHYDKLLEDSGEVLRTLIPRQMEIQTKDNSWYTVRIGPYRTTDNMIDGVVVTFNNVTELKHVEMMALAAQRLAANVVDMVRAPLVVLDSNFSVISANLSFYSEFTTTKAETEGRSLFELNNRAWDIQELRGFFEKILPDKKSIDNFIVEQDFGKTGKQKFIINARQIDNVNEESTMILMSFETAPEIENK
jgi:two-component system CheB/CheR fusion protein